MGKHKVTSDNGFDRVASFYDPLSRLVFGNAQRKAQAHWIGRIPPAADLLVFGGGSGRLLSALLDACSPRKVIYIDASSKMIELARRRSGSDGRVDFRTGNEDSIRPSDRVDVILTPFVLDLFSEKRLTVSILPKLYRALSPGGLWLGTDFVPTNHLGHSALLKAMYLFFRFTSHIEAHRLPDWKSLMENELGLHRERSAGYFGGMIETGIWRKD
ncbi:class I SAM-dependent methyltransferase [Larkinella soli]|uniref:class I SAM-dependent methyltransferase n=1 Tax=Larkinella soli TaxID=1770527 RepID=UPI000FFBEBE2|nr:class I SAM-dependent methyltransferase [Larkinella soli]